MKALTVGGAMIDTIAIIESTAIERMTLLNAGASFLLLEEGRKTEAAEVSTHCGGGAINSAVALARLGVDCSVLVKLGRDRRAEQILARLDAEGISHAWASHDESAPTGASVHVSSHERNAAIFTFRGANTRLAAADLHDDAFEVDLVYIANLSNEAADCFPDIVSKAKAAGALVAANPGIRQLSARAGAFERTLRQLDVLALNRREALEVMPMLAPAAGDEDPLDFPEQLTPSALAAEGLRHHGRQMSVRAFLRALIARGVGSVVLTDGREGAFAASAGSMIYCSAHDARVAGTAGAGDAFVATYSALTGEGRSSETAIRAASINAAAVLAHVDTQTGLMRRADLEACLERQKPPSDVIRWAL